MARKMTRNLEPDVPNFFVLVDTNLPNPTVLLFPTWRAAQDEFDAQRARRVAPSQRYVRMGRLHYHQSAEQ